MYKYINSNPEKIARINFVLVTHIVSSHSSQLLRNSALKLCSYCKCGSFHSFPHTKINICTNLKGTTTVIIIHAQSMIFLSDPTENKHAYCINIFIRILY